MTAPGLFTIAADAGFLDSIARAWLESCDGNPVRSGDGVILLPTRRGVRALTDAFLRLSGRPALLLPRIDAIGAVDEAPLAVAGVFDQPPAIGRLARQAALARLVMSRPGAERPTLGAALELAASLADLIDEAARWDVDLAASLPSLATGALALHWQVTLDFLAIVTTHWPRALQSLGMIDPAARQVASLRAQAALWRRSPPTHPVWLAGVIAATPAEIELAHTVAASPQGRVIMPGLDLELDDESWSKLGDGHPQAGLKRLLAGVGAARGDVRPLAAPPAGRVALLRRAMLPAEAIAARWRDKPVRDDTFDTEGLSVIAAADEQSEATAIALTLRDAIETPGVTAALVTPDRGLATRVAAELGRFGVIADDSAGEPLSETPPAVFLRLVAAAITEDFAPATLLAMLKHPFAQLGLSQAACRREARRLERLCLRGPRPQPGLDGFRRSIDPRASEPDQRAVASFLDRLEAALQPLLTCFAAREMMPARLVEALIETAEQLAEPDRLWADEEGEAAALHVAELSEALAPLAPQPARDLPGLLDASWAGISVRGRRALRGQDVTEIHPRVSIWGLLEARGQRAELLVLGGLVEGVWPAATDPGPWMGRPMRAAIGLPSPEIAIGVAAHDFSTLVCAAPRVVVSYAKRRDRAPAVPSRWIARLDACLAGLGRRLQLAPALGWAALLDQPDGPPRPARPPTPRPPVGRRPRRLSVTEIETWLHDPYAIYAAHILRLRPMPPIDEAADRALFGNLVHDGLAEAYRTDAVSAPGLQACFESALQRYAVRPGVAAWWRPRLGRIAEWVAEQETLRRQQVPVTRLAVEIPGRVELAATAGPFTLTGRADRIEIRDGLSILDYKTGSVPSGSAVKDGWSPQLPLEATMAALGGFGDAYRGLPIRELAYWKLSGGPQPGEIRTLDKQSVLDDACADAWNGLERRIEQFDELATAYLAQPFPSQAPRYDNYGVLARVAEWRATEDEE